MKSNLKRLRKEAGLTQAELAEKAGVAVSQVCKLEGELHTNPTMRTALLIGKALDVGIFKIWEFK